MAGKEKGGFELRTFIFIDQLQPQLAQFIAKDNRVYDPKEYDAAILLELAPAMEIHRMIDLALKATRVRLGSVVTERVYGTMQIQHEDQGEVIEAGEAVLRAAGKTKYDRSKVELVTNMTIRGIQQDHAIYFTGTSAGNMVLAGDSVLILECAPAAYMMIAANEALKAANVRLTTVNPFGATGRLVLCGPESEIDTAAAAATSCLNALNAEVDAYKAGK